MTRSTSQDAPNNFHVHAASPWVPSLEYSISRRRWRRWIPRVVLLVFVIASLWFAGQHLIIFWHQWDEIAWQHRSASYTAPANQVVYEDDPEAAKTLLDQPGYIAGQEAIARTPVAMFIPPLLSGASNKGFATMSSSSPAAVLFLHERRSSAGVRRILFIQCDPGWDPARSMPGYFSCQLMRPIVPGIQPSVESLLMDVQDSLVGIPTERLSIMPSGPLRIRFYAGQHDVADDSHFTIAYEMVAGRGTVDGWLNADGRDITFKVRDGPASTPPGE